MLAAIWPEASQSMQTSVGSANSSMAASRGAPSSLRKRKWKGKQRKTPSPTFSFSGTPILSHYCAGLFDHSGQLLSGSDNQREPSLESQPDVHLSLPLE